MNQKPRFTRRRFLQTGSLASPACGQSVVNELRARAAGQQSSVASDTAVILVWLTGGLSHMDSYDLKPEAPLEHRGEFQPIETGVPGMDVCELLPLHAKVADRFSLIGSTDSLGEGPKERPLSPNDLWATVYRHLGIDPEHSFPDHSGRPLPILPDGEPIRELM